MILIIVSMKMMNIIGDRESPCGTPLCSGNSSESPQTVLVIAFMLVMRFMIRLISVCLKFLSWSVCASLSHSTLS